MSDKDGRHGLVERGAIHVDGGPDRQHEADDASVDVVVLKEALEGDRQSGRAAETSINIRPAGQMRPTETFCVASENLTTI